jgi:hypothetical protein
MEGRYIIVYNKGHDNSRREATRLRIFIRSSRGDLVINRESSLQELQVSLFSFSNLLYPYQNYHYFNSLIIINLTIYFI